MKRVHKIQTADGALHDTLKDAQRHANARYADALLKLAHLFHNQRFDAVAELIDKQLDAFAALRQLKDDIALIANEEDDDHA